MNAPYPVLNIEEVETIDFINLERLPKGISIVSVLKINNENYSLQVTDTKHWRTFSGAAPKPRLYRGTESI